jgi:hypothetical protein
MNARVQKASSKGESRHIGPHTFDNTNIYIQERGENVHENREMFLGLLKKYDLFSCTFSPLSCI